MVTTYTVLKTIHILAAVTWLRGSFGMVLIELRARAMGPDARGQFIRQVAYVAPRTFIPASLVLIGTGFWMIGNGSLPYDTWVILAIVGWGVTFLSGNLLLAPTSKKATERLDKTGAADPETGRFLDRFVLAVRLDQVILTLIVIDMVLKPGS